MRILDFQKDIFLLQHLLSNQCENVIYFSNIFPLFDSHIFKKLLGIHIEYHPDYTFAENLPAGLVPVILNKSVFEILKIENSKDEANNGFSLEKLLKNYRMYLFVTMLRKTSMIFT